MRKRTRLYIDALRKREARNVEIIGALTKKVDDTRQRLKVLECPHEHTEIIRNSYRGMPQLTGGYEECESCGKILKTYTREELLVEQLARTKDGCSEKTPLLKAELKEVRAKEK